MLSGQHAARRHPNRLPIIISAAATAILVTSAAAALQLNPEPTGLAAPVPTRPAADERADRGEPRESSVPVPTPTTPSARPTTSKASKRPTGNPNAGTCGVSYYETGSRTANGEPFNPDGRTAAHRTLPFNTRVRVTNTANGKSVEVRINDRGPFISGRCLDLARGAFVAIASLGTGVITARYEVLK